MHACMYDDGVACGPSLLVRTEYQFLLLFFVPLFITVARQRHRDERETRRSSPLLFFAAVILSTSLFILAKQSVRFVQFLTR